MQGQGAATDQPCLVYWPLRLLVTEELRRRLGTYISAETAREVGRLGAVNRVR